MIKIPGQKYNRTQRKWAVRMYDLNSQDNQAQKIEEPPDMLKHESRKMMINICKVKIKENALPNGKVLV